VVFLASLIFDWNHASVYPWLKDKLKEIKDFDAAFQRRRFFSGFRGPRGRGGPGLPPLPGRVRDKALAEEDRKGQINIFQGEIAAMFFFLKGIFLEAEQRRVGGPLMVAEIEDTIVILEEVAQGMMNFPLRDSKETFQAFVVARRGGHMRS